jgi:putative ATP-binding cassette transporter
MVIIGAFNQVQTALRWFVDNFSNLADWRATLLRVARFRKAILGMDDLGQAASRIRFAEAEGTSIRIDDLHIASPAGSVVLNESHLDLRPGERVLITSESAEEKALLFRAISGLWPWGSCQITRPPRQSIVFLPMQAFVPPGVLRNAITYPHSAEPADDANIAKTLVDVGLEHLEAKLGNSDRWEWCSSPSDLIVRRRR